jgi:hypothetical protein
MHDDKAHKASFAWSFMLSRVLSNCEGIDIVKGDSFDRLLREKVVFDYYFTAGASGRGSYLPNAVVTLP